MNPVFSLIYTVDPYFIVFILQLCAGLIMSLVGGSVITAIVMILWSLRRPLNLDKYDVPQKYDVVFK